MCFMLFKREKELLLFRSFVWIPLADLFFGNLPPPALMYSVVIEEIVCVATQFTALEA